MSYINTFIQVAPDCPVDYGVVPTPRGEKKTIPVIQYELLSRNPYKYDFDELLFETHVRHKGISQAELDRDGDDIRRALFAKSHPCLRASALSKKYGWGVHHDEQGKIAIWGRETDEYRRFTEPGDGKPELTVAMRSKRA